MPNGKGQIDCCYCIHFRSKYEGSDAMYDEGFCKFHRSEIPSTLSSWNHRICVDFEPNKFFENYLQYNSLEQRFNWFGKELTKNVLYEFHYNDLNGIRKLKDL
jgi:hypothetical protein